MAELVWIDLGRAAYAPTLRLQERLRDEVEACAGSRAYLVLVEHDPPVLTMGRRPAAHHILASPEALAEKGIEVHPSSRGGDVTYHGPGQLVAYLIMSLHGHGVRRFQRELEEVVIRTLARLGIAGARREGFAGVWVGGAAGEEKIAAIGVAVRRWVSYHGLAINASPDLSHFDLIVPCGIRDRQVTSVTHLLGRRVEVAEVKPLLIEAAMQIFGFSSLRQETRTVKVAEAAVRTQARFPAWLRKRLPAGGQAAEVHGLLKELGLNTVCAGAHCPNLPECFARRTATFMILGDCCTRACRFCAVGRGPEGPPRADEPAAVAEACRRMGLRHVVLTSVTRDDLPDGGAGHFAETILAVCAALPAAVIEVLTPDFQGRRESIDAVLAAGPDIFNHNVETVPRLYPIIRGQAAGTAAADYRRSLQVLAYAKHRDGKERGGAPRRPLYTKSGLMLGLGEEPGEVRQTLRDLREAGCDILTIGQYLAPSTGHVQIARFVTPEEFAAWRQEAKAMGFRAVAAGPFVRSSYQAESVFGDAQI